MLDLQDDDHPAKRGNVSRPLTALERQQVIIILVVFVVWLPVYLIWVRSAFNRIVFQYVNFYPAMLHLVPLIGVPVGIAMLYGRVSSASRRDSSSEQG